MSKVKIVTTKPSRFGKKLIVPNAGEVQISVEGTLEVDAETAEILVEKSVGWDYVSKAPAKKEIKKEVVEEPISEEPVVEEMAEETTTNGEVDLSDYTKKELQQLASDAEMPESEWKKLNKSNLVAYLNEKMQ